VIIQLIDIENFAAIEAKNYPPVCTDSHCPIPREFTLQWMEPESWNLHILNRFSCIEAIEDISQFDRTLRRYSAQVVVFEEAFQTLVSKGLDHDLS